MVVLIFEARNAGMFCVFVSIGMILGVVMIMYTLSSESDKLMTYSGHKDFHGKSRQKTNNMKVVVHHSSMVKSDYDGRKELLDHKCKHMSQAKSKGKSSSQMRSSSYDQFIVDDKYKIIYCWVPKVASSNWKYVLSNLRQNYTNNTWVPNSRDKNIGLPTLARYSSSERTARLKTYFKFLFVRHPLERLLSAYRNRFEARTHSARSYAEHFSTFSKFVQFLDGSHVQRQTFNIHWRPIIDLCDPCQVDYDFIGHYETLQDDVDYLFNHLHIENVHFPKTSSYATKSSDPDALQRYYANLTSQELNTLYTIYVNDFDLFAYERNY